MSNSKCLNLVVGVLTYKRFDGIQTLLTSLLQQRIDPARPYKLTVIVVDNDKNATSRDVVERFSSNDKYELRYVVEPRQGIPVARNRALDSAPLNTDYFCFIDDDEWPIDTWLDELLIAQAATGADCVHGNVVPVYPDNAPRFFVRSKVFESAVNPELARIGYAASNNVMFRYGLIRDWNLRFDEAMLHTGGTDYVFFKQAVHRGMTVVWSGRAMVYDVIPRQRMTWRWILQRQYRLGNTFAVSDTLHGSLSQRAFRLGYGSIRATAGFVMLPALLFSPRLGMRALVHLFRGLGMVAGLMGHFYEEYRPG